MPRARSALLSLFLLAAVAPGASAQSPGQGVAEEFDRLHFRSIGPATMSGRIADVAPTMLELLGLPVPEEMTGRSLVPGG